jgi:hypothetical protein
VDPRAEWAHAEYRRADIAWSAAAGGGMAVNDLPWFGEASLFASGCDALVALIGWGARRHGWRRVWLPSYYCPEVPAALRALAAEGVETCAYPDHAIAAPPAVGGIPAASRDVVVVANQLGVRRGPDTGRPAAAGAVVVEDHSHDLGSAWARASDADYAFASLRKTLPLPDGGAVWSPRGHEVPPEPPVTEDSGGPALDRLVAALLRREDRVGAIDGPLPFRALARSAAGRADPTSPAGISPVSRALLPHMPTDAWREQRRRNFGILACEAYVPRHARTLLPPAGGVAFAFTVVFDAEGDRERVENALIERAVVPSVLWPLDPTRDPGAGPADADLSRRILSVHCDQRYDPEAMERLAGILGDALHA